MPEQKQCPWCGETDCPQAGEERGCQPPPPKVIGAPDEVWLCYGDISEDVNHADCDVTWCDDQIESSDVRYVRADIADTLRAELEAARTEVTTLKGELGAEKILRNGADKLTDRLIGDLQNADGRNSELRARIAELEAMVPMFTLIEDELPDYEEPVLIFVAADGNDRDAYMVIGYYSYWEGRWRVFDDEFPNEDIDHMTHWMPLPAAPDEGSK